MGVALVPRLTAQAEITRGQVAALAVREMKFERKLYLVYRKGATLSHAARAFLRVAREQQKPGKIKSGPEASTKSGGKPAFPT
jgi:DNA-binding transcriptional LysR family regulator